VAYVALLAGAVGIAFAPIFVRLSELGPTATAFYRLLFALPVLGMWMWFEERGAAPPRRPSKPHDYRRLIGAGLFFAADLAIWHRSIALTSVANATLLANFSPIFVTLGAWVLLRERVNRSFLLGLGLAMVGTITLMGESVALSAHHAFGNALALLAAVFYSGYLLTVRRLRNEFSTATIMAWSGAVTCAALLPLALASGEDLLVTSASSWAVLIGLALVSHAGGQGLIAFALAYLSAPFSSVALLLQPVVSAGLAWAILSEPLRPWQGLGGIIVLAGIALARRGAEKA